MDGVWVGGRGLPDMTTTINPQLPAMPFRRQQPPFFSCSLPREDGKIFIECKKRMRIQIAKENFGGFIFFRFVGLKTYLFLYSQRGSGSLSWWLPISKSKE